MTTVPFSLSRYGLYIYPASQQFGFCIGPDLVHCTSYTPQPWHIMLVWDPIPPEERQKGRSIFRRSIQLVWTWRPDVYVETIRDWPSYEPGEIYASTWTGRRRRFIWCRWRCELWWR